MSRSFIVLFALLLIVGCESTTVPATSPEVTQMDFGLPWHYDPPDTTVDTTKSYEPAIITYLEEEDLMEVDPYWWPTPLLVEPNAE